MDVDLKAGIVRILKPDGGTAGTGFVVSDEGLIVTCAHVVWAKEAKKKGLPRPDVVTVVVHATGDRGTAAVEPAYWRDLDAEDMAILRLEGPLLERVTPLPLGSSADAEGREFHTFGFPEAKPVEGMAGKCEVVGCTAEAGFPVLQLRSSEVSPGFSGAPVWSTTTHRVVGMVNSITAPDRYGRLAQAAFATPSETLHAVCPTLMMVALPDPGAEDRTEARSHVEIEGRGVVVGDYNVIHQIIQGQYPLLHDFVYDFASTIESVTRWFVGREFVFQSLDALLSGRPCGYLRLIADAGLGKSAIAAEIVRRYHALPFFLNAREGCTRPEQVLNHLSACLIARYGLPEDHLPPQAGLDSTFLQECLLKAAARRPAGEPVLLVLDALDEADPPPPECNWLYLPGRLPEGVYAFLTHRPGDYRLATEASTRVETLTIAWDDPRQQTDIEAYLQQQALRPEIYRALDEAAPPITVERFVATLKEASEGNFMYLDYVLADLADREPGFDPLQLETLPHGLGGYYGQFWSRMEQVRETDGWETWDRLYLPILEGLGVAGEPVTAGWLADRYERSEREVRERVLQRWRRFLRCEERDGTLTWGIVHQSFADFLAEKVDLRAGHERISAYYWGAPDGWKEHDAYALRFLSTHLVRAGRERDLQDLVLDPTWLQSHKACNPALRAYVGDVKRALSIAAAQGVDGLPNVIALGLLLGSTVTRGYELTAEQVAHMVHTHQIDPLLEWADRLPDGDWFKIDLVQSAGEVALLAGRRDRAIAELRRAAKQVAHLRSFMMSEYLRSITADLMACQDEQGLNIVLDVASEMTDHFLYRKEETSRVLHQALEALRQGEVDQFYHTLGFRPHHAIEKLTSPSYMQAPPKRVLYAAEETALAWASWAETLAKCGEAELAHNALVKAQASVDLMGQEQHQDRKARVLARLAQVGSILERPASEVERLFDEAIGSAERPPDATSQISAKVYLAGLSVQFGYTERAQRLLQSIFAQFRVDRQTIYYRTLWLSQLAPCAGLLLQLPGTLERWIESEPIRALIDLTWRAHQGNVVAARDVLTTMDNLQDPRQADPYLMQSYLSTILPALAAHPNELPLEKASATSRRMLRDDLRWLNWLALALSTVPIGSSTAALLERSLKNLYARAPEDTRVQLALATAPSLAYLSVADRDWVLALICDVFCQPQPFHRSTALLSIERFAPLVLTLGGRQAVVETWSRIQSVEHLFD